MAETVSPRADSGEPARFRLFRQVAELAARTYAGGLPPESWPA